MDIAHAIVLKAQVIKMKPFKMSVAVRKVNKRGYVYIGRANAGHNVEITTKPSAPTITVLSDFPGPKLDKLTKELKELTGAKTTEGAAAAAIRFTLLHDKDSVREALKP